MVTGQRAINKLYAKINSDSIFHFEFFWFQFKIFIFAFRFQMASLSVSDSVGNTYDNAKFNIYSCLYSFLCRQVALGPLNEIAVRLFWCSTEAKSIQSVVVTAGSSSIYNYMVIHQVALARRQRNDLFGLRVNLPPVYHIRWRLHSILFY